MKKKNAILDADFLAEKFGLSESEAQNMNRELFTTYGSSLAGLRVIIPLIIPFNLQFYIQISKFDDPIIFVFLRVWVMTFIPTIITGS